MATEEDGVSGILIALEGIDGSGTTTQRDLLGTYLRSKGYDILLTAEPSTGEIGQMIRRILRKQAPMTEPALALLFAADRLDHLNREIEPALERDTLVLSDRYLLSSLAYQSLDLPMEWVQEINALARVPDATFFLRVSPATAATRRAQRDIPDERFETRELQERIARAYEEALKQPAAGEVRTIDGKGGIEAVADELRRLVDEHLAEAGRAP